MEHVADDGLRLTVYFDAECGLCRAAANWLERQPQLVPIDCVAAQSTAAVATCPLTTTQLLEKVTVIATDGAIYYGAKAWIICLWALANYRAWSLRLSTEAMLPWATRLFELAARLR